MQVVVTGRHLEVTEALQSHATQRAQKACEHLAEPPAHCKVVIGKDASENHAEFVLSYHGRDFASHAKNPSDMYAAIDTAANRLQRQLDDFNGREHGHR